jgi:hypothetical protein
MEDAGIFYGHLVHFTVFCYILFTFSIVRGNLVHFSRFGILYQEKSGNPGPEHIPKFKEIFLWLRSSFGKNSEHESKIFSDKGQTWGVAVSGGDKIRISELY